MHIAARSKVESAQLPPAAAWKRPPRRSGILSELDDFIAAVRAQGTPISWGDKNDVSAGSIIADRQNLPGETSYIHDVTGSMSARLGGGAGGSPPGAYPVTTGGRRLGPRASWDAAHTAVRR